jgi:hypothetical protein
MLEIEIAGFEGYTMSGIVFLPANKQAWLVRIVTNKTHQIRVSGNHIRSLSLALTQISQWESLNTCFCGY